MRTVLVRAVAAVSERRSQNAFRGPWTVSAIVAAGAPRHRAVGNCRPFGRPTRRGREGARDAAQGKGCGCGACRCAAPRRARGRPRFRRGWWARGGPTCALVHHACGLTIRARVRCSPRRRGHCVYRWPAAAKRCWWPRSVSCEIGSTHARIPCSPSASYSRRRPPARRRRAWPQTPGALSMLG